MMSIVVGYCDISLSCCCYDYNTWRLSQWYLNIIIIIKENRLAMCEEVTKDFLATPEVVGIIRKWVLSSSKDINNMLKIVQRNNISVDLY